VLAAVAAGHQPGDQPPLKPDQPVPGCTCEPCTGVKDGRFPVRRGEIDVDRAKSVSILDIATRLGLEKPRQRGKEHVIHCPLHEDRRPSLRINAGNGLWYCDVCDEGGDGIRLWECVRRVSFVDAVRELET
jgi:hypothetical protein